MARKVVKYLMCPECEGTESLNRALSSGGFFTEMDNRNFRCENCGYEGALILMVGGRDYLPEEYYEKGLEAEMNVPKPDKRNKKMQAWTLIKRLKMYGLDIDEEEQDIEDLARGTKRLLTKLNKAAASGIELTD